MTLKLGLLVILVLLSACVPGGSTEIATEEAVENQQRASIEQQRELPQTQETQRSRRTVFDEYQTEIIELSHRISIDDSTKWVPVTSMLTPTVNNNTLYAVFHNIKSVMSGKPYLAVAYNMESNEILHQQRIAVIRTSGEPNVNDLDWWNKKEPPTQRHAPQVPYKYTDYQSYAQQAIDELSEVLGVELHLYGDYSERFEESVFVMLFSRDDSSWTETLRFWVVEQSAATGEVVRYNEISNDGCRRQQTCPNTQNVWQQ